jgi:hypothetical protein
MRGRFARRVWLGVTAGVGAAFAVAAIGPVAGAVSPMGDAASAKQYEDKVTICHRTGSKKKPFHTIRVSRNALKAHLKHGDALGPCGPNSVFTMCNKTEAGKKQTVKVKGVRKATRALKKGDKLGKCKTSGKKNKAKKGKEKDKGKGEGKNKGPKKPK